MRVLSEVVLTERDGRTTVAIRWTPYESTAAEIAIFDAGQGSIRQGWTGTFDCLAEYLAGSALYLVRGEEVAGGAAGILKPRSRSPRRRAWRW